MTRHHIVGVKWRVLGAMCWSALVGFAHAHPIVAAFDRFHAREETTASSPDGGLLLLNELNCVACHMAPASWQERLPGRGKISLAGAGSRLTPEILERFIRDPHQSKPGTLMPQIAERSANANRTLAAYLSKVEADVPIGLFAFAFEPARWDTRSTS